MSEVRRGRPKGSQTRDRIVEILEVIERATGYDIFKVYREVFGSITSRSIYYNLHQGVVLDVFDLDEVKIESGEYSWGSKAEKKYYTIGRKGTRPVDPELAGHIARVWAHLRS